MHLRRFIRPLVLSGVCLAPLSAWSADAILTGDTYVSSSSPSSAYGTLPFLNVGNGSSALVQFDLSPLPAGTTSANITKANLILYVERLPNQRSARSVSGNKRLVGIDRDLQYEPVAWLGGLNYSHQLGTNIHRGRRHIDRSGLGHDAIVQFRH